MLYIDPGTGSLLISSIIGLVLTFLFTLKGFFFYKIASRFTGKTLYLKNDFSGKLVFFSEGQRYWSVFEKDIPIISKKSLTKVEKYIMPLDENNIIDILYSIL